MSLAYLLNWYPQPSQTALRREITALEQMGVAFHRFSLRRYEGELVDANDESERQRTHSVLDAGVFGFIGAVASVAVRRPRAFSKALVSALKVGLVDERGLLKTLIYFA
jgi:colanic acid/amylovoran biosynthesis glycosyltransferase